MAATDHTQKRLAHSLQTLASETTLEIKCKNRNTPVNATPKKYAELPSLSCNSNQQPQPHVLHHPTSNALNSSQLAQTRHALVAHIQIAQAIGDSLRALRADAFQELDLADVATVDDGEEVLGAWSLLDRCR